ncbi:antibiotic biosynthesis monooxygenase [Desulfopila sp. IMCC35006]|uniref:putative quinol monooxygenase n=1 Tax=Desulfopila sp. IMCC35006 TaxID=2569542 RepID=UPI0010AD4977|nr:putative quinol monooxygenase [Desulfopila sp. IMCC35006]TKB26981.1 antibiotic biosynthesis monooxygenase [Desulfopila sp. IMCC35006]
MIHVIASIHVKDGRVAEFLEIFKANVPEVMREKGCVAYEPTVDVPTGLPPQELDGNVVTIIEKWTNLEDLRAHLAAPHMLAYQKKVKNLVEKVALKVLEKA